VSLEARDPARVDLAGPVEPPLLDGPLVDWVSLLRTPGPDQAIAMTHLHQLMLRAAGHQVWRMRSQLGTIGQDGIDVLVNQSADEAMAAVLAKLDTFEGRSRFTTWAYKFAILQAASEVRRTAWREREIPLHDIGPMHDVGVTPTQHVEAADLAAALTVAMATALTPHQRRITIALLVDLVPIDVLAERLCTNRNALYKTLHDARARLRKHLVMTGHLPTPAPRPSIDGGPR
jgi:RNA polymerase sigma-70 factor (ECF subfamily)